MKFSRYAGALIAAVMMTATAPVAYAGPFALPDLVGPYPSDLPARVNYISVLDGFTELRESRPDVVQQNLDIAVAINNAASPVEQQRALFDSHYDRLLSLSDGFGHGLGEVFRVALDGGRLPKTETVLGGDLARAGGIANSTLLEKQHWNNPRPFEAAPERIHYYFGDGTGGAADPYAEVFGTSSYPSGHTAQAYWKGILLADMLPELAPQILARASEVGNSRIVLGVHYPLDVMGARIMGQAAAADRLNDPAFVRLVDEAKAELRSELERSVGAPLADYIESDLRYRSLDAARGEYRNRLTYGFEPVDPAIVNDIPADAAVLLRSVAPHLTDEERLGVLRDTALPAGYPLDRAGSDGGWLRIDLAAAYATV
ncbi:phosphatase PAP2 family protein [Rhodococcus sp. BL-253-APC-6A1W]|uniref:acid phosphatase n=1 Tax=Rhodococcus sp. BL-253-APC-6A1W TaxID=2725307 RepID=UPI00146AB0BD|nr:phosphatase PAP2 family protein [Rhodococcus sp. BL-253-APC-6A1W]NMD97093.1 phosphatase PAP2 family protein [Rhodococcus sp. BL-253-APC-6A1W]